MSYCASLSCKLVYGMIPLSARFPSNPQATSLHKRLTKQLKEYRDHGWDIIEQTKSQVDAFRRALPLIMDLKNVALRPRHWEEIRALIGRSAAGMLAEHRGKGMKARGDGCKETHWINGINRSHEALCNSF